MADEKLVLVKEFLHLDNTEGLEIFKENMHESAVLIVSRLFMEQSTTESVCGVLFQDTINLMKSRGGREAQRLYHFPG